MELLHQNGNRYISWKELEIRIKTGTIVDTEIRSSIEIEAEKCHSVFEVIVDVNLHCTRNNWQLRGDLHSICVKNFGIFLNTLESVSHYHHPLS